MGCSNQPKMQNKIKIFSKYIIFKTREYKIKSPLLENRIGKKEIRKIARRYNISVANKPSNSCLASRIPYGNNITQEKLKKIFCDRLYPFKIMRKNN